MFGIIVWIFILIIWIGNIIIRTRPSMKDVEGNGFQILVAVLFIMLSVVNIVGIISALDNNQTTVDSVEITTEEQTSNGEEFYYIKDSY